GMVLLSFLYLFIRFVQSASSSAQFLSSANTYWSSFRDNLEYSGAFLPEQIVEATGVLPANAAEATVQNATGSAPAIEIRNVSFRYEGMSSDVVRNLST